MRLRFQRQLSAHSGALSWSTYYVETAANRLDAISEATQPRARYAGRIEAATIICDLNLHPCWGSCQPYASVLCPGVLKEVCAIGRYRRGAGMCDTGA